jgi:hypothetical protein
MKQFFQGCDSTRTNLVFISSALLVAFFGACTSGASALTRQERVEFLEGVTRAIACETEIDDDLQGYRDCINYALLDRGTSATKQLGVRFQGWIIADLMMRQHAVGAATFASSLREQIQRSVRDRSISIEALCRLKAMPCRNVILGLDARSGRSKR